MNEVLVCFRKLVKINVLEKIVRLLESNGIVTIE